MGSLILPTFGLINADAQITIYSADSHPSTRPFALQCTLFVPNDTGFKHVPGLPLAILDDIIATP